MTAYIAAEGHGENETDSTFIVAGLPLDQLVIPSGLTQSQLEDMQLWSFLGTITATGGRHPLSIRAVPAGEDPPDRYLSHGEDMWATELTEMTIGQVRSGLARVRVAGRTLEQRLRERISDFPHLPGKVIALNFVSNEVPPKDPGDAVRAIEAALAQDKGVVGEGHDYSQGLPEQLPPHGFYGQIEDFDVQIYPQQGLEAPVVTALIPAYIKDGEIADLLDKRLVEKDDPRNKLLIISCGLPDKAGYICPPDTLLFHRVKEKIEEGVMKVKKPEYLQLVALHSPVSNEMVELYRATDAVAPWDPESING